MKNNRNQPGGPGGPPGYGAGALPVGPNWNGGYGGGGFVTLPPPAPVPKSFRNLHFRQHQARPQFRSLTLVPEVAVTPQAYADMQAIAGWAGYDEIGWLGSVHDLGDSRYVIDRVFMVAQEVDRTTTRMTEDGLAELFTELIIENPDLVNRMRFWGHVHPHNSTHPSPQDEKQMEILRAQNPWFIRGIFCPDGQVKFDLFDYQHLCVWEDIPWSIQSALDAERQAHWGKLVESRVSDIVRTPPPGTYQRFVDEEDEEEGGGERRGPFNLQEELISGGVQYAGFRHDDTRLLEEGGRT